MKSGTMCQWSEREQSKRREWLGGMIRRKFRPLLGDDARSEHLVWWDQPRVAIWSTNAFFIGGAEDIAFANTIMRYVRDVLKPQPGPNVFEASALATALALHGDKMEPDVKSYATESLAAFLPYGCAADFQFHGYNDNMPVMWTWALAFGGEFLKEPKFTKIAWANLHQVKDMLRRRGAVSEYGQGYSTHRITGFAHIVEHVADKKMRTLAKEVEARIWAELAGHWSPMTAQFCGASMRGGHIRNPESASLMWQVFGDGVLTPALPRDELYERSPAETAKELGLDPEKFLMAYMFGYSAEFASATYHVPERAAELFHKKPKGFTFACTAENGYFNEGIFCKQIPVYGTGGVLITTKPTNEMVVLKDFPEHGAQPHGLVTHHGANYAVGTSTTRMFRTSHAFRCTYRRAAAAKSAAGFCDILLRYNINDKTPGGRLKNTYWKSPDYPSEQKENYCLLYQDMGAHHCLQHKNSVMLVSAPSYLECWDVRSLRLDLLFFQQHGKVGGIRFDGKPVPRLPFEAAEPGLITIDEGPTRLAIRPLIGRSLERKCAVKIHEVNEFLLISLYNYEGPSRSFTQHEIAKLGNGFILEVRDAERRASFDDFQREMASAKVLDQLYGGRRRVHYARKGLRLSTHYCPYTRTTMYDAVNGLNHEIPQFQYSDDSHKGLPFLDAKPAVGFEDWDWLETQMTRPMPDYNPTE